MRACVRVRGPDNFTEEKHLDGSVRCLCVCGCVCVVVCVSLCVCSCVCVCVCVDCMPSRKTSEMSVDEHDPCSCSAS